MKTTAFIAFIYFLTTSFTLSDNKRLKVSSNPLKIPIPENADSSYLPIAMNRYINAYRLNGYLEANMDGIKQDSSTFYLEFYSGPRYKMKVTQLLIDSPIYIPPIQGFSTAIDSTVFLQQALMVLNHLEQNGYPFSSVKPSFQITDSMLNVRFTIQCGIKMYFDSIQLEDNQLISPLFLGAYLGMKPNMHYNELAYKAMDRRLQQLPFLSLEHPSQMAFYASGKAKPFVYVKSRPCDQVNAVLGFAPNANNAKLLLTGEMQIKLNNLFRSAKALQLHWRSFKPNTQELKSSINLPYLFASPLGLDFKLNFLKYDSSFSTNQTQIGCQYYTSGLNGFQWFYQRSSTNLNLVDTSEIRLTKRLPNAHSMINQQYGMQWQFTQLDNPLNPLKGLQIEARASLGYKTLIKLPTIEQLTWNGKSIYDSMKLKTLQGQYALKAELYSPINSSQTIKLGCYVSQIVSDQIYFNELFREGGLNSLKGFNEQSIFASNFNMLDLEYRKLLSPLSHVKCFVNGAYYEDKNNSLKIPVRQTAIGFGLGASLQTSAGLLQIVYALGKTAGEPILIKNGKFHLGINSYF